MLRSQKLARRIFWQAGKVLVCYLDLAVNTRTHGSMDVGNIIELQCSSRRPGLSLLVCLLASNCLDRRLGHRIKAVGVVDSCFAAMTCKNG